MSVQLFFDKGPQQLLWARSRAARGKITVSRTLNPQLLCNVYSIHKIYNSSHITKLGKPRVGQP